MGAAEDHLDPDLTVRALAWTRAAREAVCDVREPWEHGTVLRASRYPSWYDVNVVRVEDDPGMSVADLAAFSDRALAGLGHRMITFEVAGAGARLRAQFEAAGWTATALVWMHHEGPRLQGYTTDVREVHYDVADGMRAAWHEEDFPGTDDAAHRAARREVSLDRGTRVLAVHEDGEPVGFAALEPVGGEIEIGAVYVLARHRGGGRGTALTRAAVAAAGDVEHLWICADADDRPRHLYARLGFRPVLSTIEFLRVL